MLVECKSKFFTLLLETNRAKVDFLASALDVTIEGIADFIVDLALPVEGTATFNDRYGHVMLLNSSVKELKIKVDLLIDILGVDIEGDDILSELKPIINLNSDLCSFIATELFNELDGLEGCGRQIAVAYTFIDIRIRNAHGYSACQMLDSGNTEIIAEILERYRSL